MPSTTTTLTPNYPHLPSASRYTTLLKTFHPAITSDLELYQNPPENAHLAFNNHLCRIYLTLTADLEVVVPMAVKRLEEQIEGLGIWRGVFDFEGVKRLVRCEVGEISCLCGGDCFRCFLLG